MFKWWKERSRSTRTALAFGATVVVILIVAGLSALYRSDEVMAAWIQAVGTLIAIVIAVAVPEYEAALRAAEAEQERTARAQSLAVLLYMDLEELRPKLKTLSQRLSRTSHQLRHVGGGLQVNPGDIRLDIPPFLMESRHDFHRFDSKTMGSVTQLLSLSSQYGRMLTKALPDTRIVTSSNAALTQRHVDALRRHVIVCRRNARDSVLLVGAIHDQVVT